MSKKPINHYAPWTMQELRLIRQLRAEGKGRKEIAEKLGRTVPSLAYQIKRLGIQGQYRRPSSTYV